MRTRMLGSSRRSRLGLSKRARTGKTDGRRSPTPRMWASPQTTNHVTATVYMAAGVSERSACNRRVRSGEGASASGAENGTQRVDSLLGAAWEGERAGAATACCADSCCTAQIGAQAGPQTHRCSGKYYERE